MTDLTINELHQLLGELIKDGYGNKKFQIYTDMETKYTSIPKKSRIFVFTNSIRFSDYENFISKDRLIEGILEKMELSE